MTIVNQNDFIDLVYPTKTISLRKEDTWFSMDARFNCIYAHCPASATDPNGRGSYTIDFTKVTSPAAANIQSLLLLLQSYANTANIVLYERTFTNADLVLNVLTTIHGLNGDVVICTVTNPAGLEVIKVFTQVDKNTVTQDFGGAIAAGTWKQKVLVNPD
jgi:hypothetical protein